MGLYEQNIVKAASTDAEVRFARKFALPIPTPIPGVTTILGHDILDVIEKGMFLVRDQDEGHHLIASTCEHILRWINDQRALLLRQEISRRGTADPFTAQEETAINAWLDGAAPYPFDTLIQASSNSPRHDQQHILDPNDRRTDASPVYNPR